MEISKEKFEKLNGKYLRLLEESRNVHRTLNLIGSHVPNVTFRRENKEILFFKQIGSIFYLNSNREKNCLVCGKDRKTTAHHLVPRRAKCKNKILKELRIRICNECDKKVHPEHKWFANGDVAEQNKLIKKLTSQNKRLKDKVRNK